MLKYKHFLPFLCNVIGRVGSRSQNNPIMEIAPKAYKKRWSTKAKLTKLDPKSDVTLVRAEVRRALARRTETKKYIATIHQADIFAARSGVVAPQTVALLPYVPLGTNEGSRIGDVVYPKYGKLRMLFNLNASGSSNVSLPVGVKWWIVRSKQLNLTPASVGVATFDTFFDALGTQVGFAANSSDLVAQVNTNMWQVFDEGVVILGAPIASLGFTTSASSCFSTNPPVQMVEVDYTKFLRKKLTYQQGFSSPANDNVLVVFTCQYLSDGQNATIGNALAAVTYSVDCGFTDA